MYELIAKAGRVDWRFDVNTVIALAQHKLSSDINDPSRNCVLGLARWSFSSFDIYLSEHLVANHMATLLLVNKQRTAFNIKYPPEVVITEAAAQLMRNQEARLSVLHDIRSRLRDGQIQPDGDGHIGEFVASAVFLLTYDEVVIKNGRQFFFEPIPVWAYLEQLFGPEAANDLPEVLMSAHLSFLQWFRVDTDISPALLRDAYERRYAIVCKPRQESIDLVIPIVASPPVPRDGSATFIPEDRDFSGILIQVKNLRNVFYSSHRRQCNRRMIKMFPKLPFISILVQVGEGGMGARTKSLEVTEIRRYNDAYPAWSFAVPSIDCFKSLDAGVKSILKDILCFNVFVKSVECQYKSTNAPKGQDVELLSGVTKVLGTISDKWEYCTESMQIIKNQAETRPV